MNPKRQRSASLTKMGEERKNETQTMVLMMGNDGEEGNDNRAYIEAGDGH